MESDPFYYEVAGLVYVYVFNKEDGTKEMSKKIPHEPLKFRIVNNNIDEDDKSIYYVIQFLEILDEPATGLFVKSSKESFIKPGNTTFINSDDNNEYFWISKADLDKYIAGKFIKNSYRAPHVKLTYGANISVPFKLRPKVNEQNIKITPDITLGGYLGLKWRLSRSEPLFVNFPVATIGLATLALNDNTNQASTTKGDGLVLGITRSVGAIFQLNDFQLGFMYGRDTAAGELGKDWIYNNKDWFSFSIGYSFIGQKIEGKN